MKHFIYTILLCYSTAFVSNMKAQEPSKPAIKAKPVKQKSDEEKAKELKEAEHRARQREGMNNSKAEDEAAMKVDYEKKLQKEREKAAKEELKAKEKMEKEKEQRKKKAEEDQKKGKSKHSAPAPLGGGN